MIDLQPMQGVRIDPETKRAFLESGSRLGQLDHECAAFKLATTAGTVSADESMGAGRYYYMKTGMLTQLNDHGIEVIVESFSRMPSCYVNFFDHGGRAYRATAPTATAFPNRDMLFTIVADPGFLHELCGFGSHDGGLSRQLRRQFRTLGCPEGQVRPQ